MAADDRHRPEPEQLLAIERWFLRRGTPHLIEGYNARRDILTRALPVLAAVLLVEAAWAVDGGPWWRVVAGIAGGVGVVVGSWVVVNVARGRSPLRRPDHVGGPEVAVFVLAPALGRLVVAGVGQALAVAAANVAALVVVYLVTSYGLVPLTRWAIGKTVRELGAVGGLVGRALPLLLLIQIVLFVNTEVWQVASGFDGAFLAATVGLFLLVGLAFLLTRLPRELGRLGAFEGAADLRAAVAGTPAEGGCGDGEPRPAPLSARQHGNVLLVALVSQAIQVVLVTMLLGACFVVLGLLTVTPEVLESWVGHPGDEIVTLPLLGRDVPLTAELLEVATFLAGFSGLYFTVVLVTDDTYREEFLVEILAELRQTLAVRAVYLGLREAVGD